MEKAIVLKHLRNQRAVAVHHPLDRVEVKWNLLSEPEKNRAKTFTHPTSKVAFLAGRSILRDILGEFSNTVDLVVGPHGKPHCENRNVPAFNLSHTASSLVIVFSPTGPIGVDIETRGRMPAHPGRLAEKVFTPQEREQLRVGATDFLRLWTRKEAVLKAMGTGFAGGADRLQPEKQLLSSRWRVEEFKLESILGAICIPDSVPLVLPMEEERF